MKRQGRHLVPLCAAGLSVAVVAAVACGTGGSRSGGNGNSPGSSGGNSSGAQTSSSGAMGTSSSGAGSSGAGADGSTGMPPPPPFTALQSYASVRKVKNLLTGLAPTAAEVAAATDPAALATLIDGWVATPQFEPKILTFFRNVFQQSQFAVADFEFQLRMRPGAFDLPYGEYGDQAFPLMFQNLEEGIARTAFYYVTNGLPLSNILTTNQFMMTTGLMSLYLQVEMPYDIHTFNWTFNQATRPAIVDTLNPASPTYMQWGYAPATTVSFPNVTQQKNGVACEGTNVISTFPGNTNLYQVLLGVVPRDVSASGAITCFEHAIQPYITPQDQSDWRLVTLRPLNAGETELRAFDLPSIRGIASGGSLGLMASRIGFFTTPAFDAVWNTNDSNQHRVTANQTLLAALGEGFTSTSVVVPPQPVSTTGLDPAHAVSGSVCLTCHVALDPLRQFWGNIYDYNDVPVAKPTTTGGVFAFANVNQTGKSLTDLGNYLLQVTDTDPTTNNVNVTRFASNMANQLCFFANSAACSEDDPLFRKIVSDFQNANYDFKTLVRELFSSALVTGAADTTTFDENGFVVSISRRDQFCGALSNRLGIADICNVNLPTPNGTDITNHAYDITRLAGSISADAFSRGAQVPVTPSDPNLFFRAGVELVCENLAVKVVDATTGPYKSTSAATVTAAIESMVSNILGYPAADATNPADPNHAPAAAILQTHYTSAISQGAATPTNALRSTFVAACESPSAVAIGL